MIEMIVTAIIAYICLGLITAKIMYVQDKNLSSSHLFGIVSLWPCVAFIAGGLGVCQILVAIGEALGKVIYFIVAGKWSDGSDH